VLRRCVPTEIRGLVFGARHSLVVAAAPLTPETRHMLGEAEFSVMKPSAIVINVGRGPVIDEAALIRALQEKKIAAAALDVFFDHPEQWELLAEHPELAMKAVYEVMRFCPVIFGALRMTTEDVELGGVIIPAGTFVMCNTAAANHDARVYAEPDRFDIMREDAPPMQTFGAGAHYCLGANLARREIADALVVMSARMRNLRHDGLAQWKPMVGISGPATLPIAFDAA